MLIPVARPVAILGFAALEGIFQLLSAAQASAAREQFERGSRLFDQRRLTEAAAAFSEAVRLDPDFAAAWKGLGAAYAAQGNYRDAVEPFRKACSLNPRLEDACYYLARALYSLNQFEAALQAFEHALTVDRHLWRVHNGIALCFEAMGRAEDAEAHFREAARQDRGDSRPDADPRIDFGAFLFRQGRVEEAVAILRQVVPGRPSARANFELGRALVHLGALDEARIHLEQAVKQDPGHAAAHLLLGKVYFRLGRIEEAERHIRLGEKVLE
jgi:superkiller protein 3